MDTKPHVYDATLTPDMDRKQFFASSSLVTATGFFRLKDLYSTLIDNVLKDVDKVSNLRVWSAGCSDGREPYSIAMAIQKWIDLHPAGRLQAFELRASDITTEMIRTGERNNYEITDSELLRVEPYKAYVELNPGSRLSIRPSLKQKIKFHVEDIIQHKALKPYHLIVCTNVLFYYDMAYRQQIVKDLAKNLELGGFIYLESMGSKFMRSLNLERILPGSHFFQLKSRM